MAKKSKRNDAYWKERFEQLEDKQYERSAAYYQDLQKQFQAAQNDIQMDIERWYQRLAENNDISYAAAKKLLKRDELEEFHWSVEKYIKAGEENAIDQHWMKELENASAKVHISRLQAMKISIQQHAELLYTKYEGGITDFLTDSYKNSYYHTAYEVAKGTGIGVNLHTIDARKVNTFLKQPWAADGANFSSRIWVDKQKLVNTLHAELSQNIIRGADPRQAIDNITKTMGVSKNQAGRLVMTESAAISSAAARECYKDLGLEQYQILATLDSITSKICREMDGRVFHMTEYEVGVTAPPFHPHCRTTTIPYFDDEFTQVEMRAARNEDTGKAYYVPADMTYPEWKKEYVDNADQKVESKVSEYLIRNHTPGQNTTRERLIINEAISILPQKVQAAINAGTIIDVGKNGASQYDYNHDILYIAEGAQREEVIHEIGHLVENKMLQEEKVADLRKQIVGMVSPLDIKSDVYYDGAGNPKEVYFLLRDEFVSEYQGRIYIDDIFDAFEPDGTFKDNLLWEFMSEPFRDYAEFPNDFKQKHEKFYDILQEVFE